MQGDSLRVDFEYLNNKLIGQKVIAQRHGTLLSSVTYEYLPGEVIETRNTSMGTLAEVTRYKLDANKNILESYCYADRSQYESFDTTFYTYDANQYLTQIKSTHWLVYPNTVNTRKYVTTSDYSYPVPGQCIISTAYDMGSVHTQILEYYTNLDPNPNAFKYAPYFRGKTDYLLIKNDGQVTYSYQLDTNLNVASKTRSDQVMDEYREVYTYSCK